jgi:3-hydroxybutyryl-CoA dehydrogenase
MNSEHTDPRQITVGIVGLGLMGTSISTCLLMAGHRLVGIAALPVDMTTAPASIRAHLKKSAAEGMISQSAEHYLENLIITDDYSELKACRLIIECTPENEAIKHSIFEKIEEAVGVETVITSNTSAIPISILQKQRRLPARFLGLHWAEPSHTTRFLEIICGDESDIKHAEWLYALSHKWAKEPTLVRKDIRGFITNRLMYAMYREAFHLVENGYATIEDVDRACRNNPGYWMTLVGVFRWMDLTGITAYNAVMEELFPTLNNRTDVPRLIRDVVEQGGKGIANGQGFYEYTPEEARLWRETYEAFSYDIRRLALRYPADLVKQELIAEQAGSQPRSL